MLTVGKHKAHLYHGDQHPASLYLGDRLITGYKILKASGTGRVELGTQPYKAALPSVVVHGEGKQDKLEGRNLFDISNVTNTEEITNSLTNMGDYLLAKTDVAGRGAGGADIRKTLTKAIAGKEYVINFQSSGKPYVYLDGSGYTWYLRTPHVLTEKDMSGLIYFYGSGNYDPCEIRNIQIEESSTPTPYEPYCGGIPAPNPQYPIEPVFLEGASVGSRGKNLVDFRKAVPRMPSQTVEILENGVMWTGNFFFIIPVEIGKGRIIRFTAKSANLGNFALHYRDGTIEYHAYTDAVTTDRPVDALYVYKNLPSDEEGMNMVFTDIQLELSSTPTPYEPFFDGGTAPLPILRALPDGSVRDEIDAVSGTVVRRVGVKEFDGSPDEEWQRNPGLKGSNAWIAPTKNYKTAVGFSTHFSTALMGREASGIFWGLGVNILTPFDMGLDTVDKFRAWLSSQKAAGTPVTIWYALAEPIIEHYDPAILRQHPGYTQLIQRGGEMQAVIDAEYYKEVN